MFDVRIIDEKAVLFENDVDVINLESLRNEVDNIRYDFPDGSYVIIYSDNGIQWFDSDGKYHRDGNMPACINTDGYIEYRKHDKIHRECGPACIWPDGSIEYWLDGKYYTKEEYQAEIAQRNLITDAIDVLRNANLTETEINALNILIKNIS